MKKVLFLTISLLFTGLCAWGQDVSAALQRAFDERFPNSTKIEWEDEDDNTYEVEFKQNGEKMSAHYNTAGNWLRTERKIAEADLPAAVQNSIRTRYAGYEIEKTKWISTPEYEAAYEVKLEQDDDAGDMEVKVLFDASGRVLQSEEKSDD